MAQTHAQGEAMLNAFHMNARQTSGISSQAVKSTHLIPFLYLTNIAMDTISCFPTCTH